MVRYPQVVRNLQRSGRGPLPEALTQQLAQLNEGLGSEVRILVRPSGTEPLVRILAEAPTQAEAEDVCARVAALVSKELG
jgi:phosphoglucosamine mutase